MNIKNKNIKRAGILFMAAVMLISSVSGPLGYTRKSAASSSFLAFEDVTDQMDFSSLMLKNLNSSVLSDDRAKIYEDRTVIVSFSGESLSDLSGDARVSEFALTSDGKEAEANIRKEQSAFLEKLESFGIDYKLEHSYVAVDNAVAIEINTENINSIRAIKGVESVVIAGTYAYPQAVSSDGVNAVNNITSVYGTGVYDSSEAIKDGLDGSGTIVAVLDTGLDYTHAAFLDMPDGKNPVRFTENDIKNILSEKDLKAEERNGDVLSVSDVYINAKVPFAYDYADNDADVYPSYSTHGTHVAGIIAGHDENGYTDKDGNHVDEEFYGVAPEAQLMICKVFTDDLEDPELGGAETDVLMAALEDCVLLGVDVINMSLGTSCGFTTSDDGDDEGEYLNRVYKSIGEEGISLICAASNDYSSGSGSVFGTNLSSNPDSGTVGSPATYASALSVASISGKKSPYLIGNGVTPIFFEESNDEDNNPFDFINMMLDEDEQTAEFEYVVVPGVGRASDYSTAIKKLFSENPNRIALVERGDTTFKEKVEVAQSMGAKAIIVYNNVSGKIRMSLGDVKDPIPSVSIDMNAGAALVEAAENRIGTVKLDRSSKAGPFMSEFSSWGSTPDLKLKPEITAHGGELTSAVPGGYDEQSGTSMAAPNMAGVVALIRGYVKTSNPEMTPTEVNRRINQLLMSTATTVYDPDGLPYSPRKQGAGLGSLANSYSTRAYLWTENEECDFRPKVELGDDKDKNGVYTVTFNVTNFSDKEIKFKTQSVFMTETLAIDKLSVAEQAYILDDEAARWTVGGKDVADGDVFSVAAGATVQISLKLSLSADEKKYIDDSFANGMFVEGFAKLISETDGQCDLALPFMGFYGDWTAAPMLDYDAYELSAFEQDSSILEDEKPKASVWGTQPYTVYSNEEYVLPMGSYVYLLPDDADPVYLTMDHNAISCFNEYYGEQDERNYLTAYKMKGLYAGLLRNARSVEYVLKNVDTGEVIQQDTVYRVGKAYADGGTARPAFVNIPLDPVEAGLVSNGHYSMDFTFTLDYGDGSAEKNTFSYEFTADYEAPILEDIRVRYYDYKDGKTTKQKIFLDLDVFDNHYSQAVTLCYQKGEELVLATEYVTPIYNSVKNGITTVSIEITDIYEKYKDSLYVQIDDYALNHSIYWLNLSAANTSTTPARFELSAGEENVTLGVYDTHTVSLDGIGEANLSNFRWTSNNRSVADVRNGEIVGLSEGTATITVTNDLQVSKHIEVVVEKSDKTLSVPSISFGSIKAGDGVLTKAEGLVKVYPGMDFLLSVQTSPWYYPMQDISLAWESTDPTVATVDDKGNVTVLEEGTAVIKAAILSDGKPTAYSATVTLDADDPFMVENYSLIKYNGPGGVVKIPTDKNITMIGENAFKDHETITEVIIPKSVTSIGKGAFSGCSALQKVYFDSVNEMPIADADVSVIYAGAFADCTSLELLDLSNVKVVTLGRECFAGCTALKEIRKMEKIGTAFERAFADCTSLSDIDISGMHVSGKGAFSGCTSLKSIKTAWFSDIGEEMFAGCTALRSVTLCAWSIGDRAFADCTGLHSVKIELPEGESSFTYYIGEGAFSGCTSLQALDIAEGCSIATIGSYAFGSTAISTFALPNGITTLGEDILSGSRVGKIVIEDGTALDEIRLLGDPFGHISLELSPDVTDYVIEDGVLYNKEKTKLIYVLSGTTKVKIPDTVTEIADYAFAGSSVTSVSIPESVKKIGKGAFKGSRLSVVDLGKSAVTELSDDLFAMSDLSQITIPKSVVRIGTSAFENTALLSVVFEGNSVKEMGDRVFAGCDHIESISLPAGISVMGSECFSGCSSLVKIDMPSVEELGERTFEGCASLVEVAFADGAKTLGTATFRKNEALAKIIFGESVEKIENEVFYGCVSLESIDLSNVTSVAGNAFAECTSLSQIKGLDRLVNIGEMAFYNNNSVAKLELASAETIGAGAFAIENGGEAYTEVSIPCVKEIGVMAFMGGNEMTVNIPSSAEKIGYGAFSGSKKLSEFSVSEENEVFFEESGVLYRKLPNGGYELVSYPGAREGDDGAYAVIDGTVTVCAYAFNRIKDDVLTRVDLPYSLTEIGASAFFESGISEYSFSSVNAPSLSAVYREDVEKIISDNISGVELAVNSLYYSNFNTLYVNYSDTVGEKSDLVMYVPANGVGYDNPIYTKYFGRAVSLGILMDDTTRAAIDSIEALEDIGTVKSWSSLEVNDENKLIITEFAERVKDARRLYNNISSEDQLAFVSDESLEKLGNIEKLTRTLKEKFSIPLVVSEVRPSDNYKKEYREGEKFSDRGLTFTVVYDDGSTERASKRDLTLKSPSDKKLYSYDNFVVYEYRYGEDESEVKEVNIPVTVKADGNVKSGAALPVLAVLVVLALLVSGGAALYILKKKNKLPEKLSRFVDKVFSKLSSLRKKKNEPEENICSADDLSPVAKTISRKEAMKISHKAPIGKVVKWILVGVAAIVLAAMIVFIVLNGQSERDDGRIPELTSQIVYNANGGLFENNMEEKTIGYADGSYPLDIGNMSVSNGSVGISRKSYRFTGWYLAALDGEGNVILDDGESVKLGEPYDFSKMLESGESVTVYAGWVKEKTMKVLLAGGEVVDKDGKVYAPGDVLRELTVNTKGQFDKFTGSKLLSLESGMYTFLQYYTDADCTTPVTWPVPSEDGDETSPIYAKFIEGDWKVVSDAASAKKMLSSLISGNYYITNDIDLAGAAVTISNSATFAARIEGNGYTISNFKVTKRGVESQGTSLFGSFKEDACLHNITFTGIDFEIMLKGDTNEIYFLFDDMPENADVIGVAVSGTMKVNCPKEAVIANLQPGAHSHWVISSGESDADALSDGALKVSVTCTVGDLTYTYPDNN